MHRLAYTAEAKSRIEQLNPRIKRQLKSAVERIAQKPDIGKRLTAELSDYWSYRTGDYRIIYQTHPRKVSVVVVTVGHRKEVYKTAARRLS